MPPLKVPSTLYNAAKVKTRLWIVQVARTIYKSAGDFDNLLCRQAVSDFNQYLITSVPTQIIDELYNSAEVLFVEETMVSGDFQNPSPYFKQKFDTRIILSMYIHKNMKILYAHRVINDTFWKLTLPSLQNLIKLELYRVCTDEILEVVGNHCRSLESVNIVSKSCHTRAKDRHNALKLQLCVSDVGLKSLSNCKQLVEIQMTCIIRKGCGGRQITNEGIKHLLQSLPKLRRINYTDTGILLDSMSPDDKLSLVSVTDYHPSASRIPKMELLCPHLTELNLTYAFSSEDYRSEVISALSLSGLKISVLTLKNFPFDYFLKNYLEIKGTYLKTFNFNSSIIQCINELFRVLGWTCPNLENMQMHFHTTDRGYISNQRPFVSSSANNENFFSHLKSLVIKGVYWDSTHNLPLLLKNAKFINTIILMNDIDSDCLDYVLRTILPMNTFSHLERVHFLKGINFSFEFFKTFLMSCPLLTNVVVESKSQTYCELVNQLREELLENNINVNIDCYIPPY